MRKRTKKILAATTLAVAACGTTVFAMSNYLNWTGSNIVVRTKLFISQATDKILAQDRLVTKLKAEKAELEKRLEEANNGGSTGGNNETIVDLQNKIIEKENEINHLTQQLERANEEVADQGQVLDSALERLDAANINMNWTEE